MSTDCTPRRAGRWPIAWAAMDRQAHAVRIALGIHLLAVRPHRPAHDASIVMHQASKVERTSMSQPEIAPRMEAPAKPHGLGLFSVRRRLRGIRAGTADWMSEFLSRYHGADPHTTARTRSPISGACSRSVACSAWRCCVSMTAGGADSDLRRRPPDVEPRVVRALRRGALGFSSRRFFASIMWPTIVSLALNSVSHLHGPFAESFAREYPAARWFRC